ncbi:MAG: hypothetical protein ABJL55_15560 [Roseibium sp.]
MNNNAIAELAKIAAIARTFLLTVWPTWQPEDAAADRNLSENTCGRSSVFLCKLLRDQGHSADFVSGNPLNGPLSEEGTAEEGLFDGHRWCSHAWVRSGSYIVDITADQFGLPPIIVTDHRDSRYRMSTKDLATPEAQARRHKTAEKLWPKWLDWQACAVTTPLPQNSQEAQ